MQSKEEVKSSPPSSLLEKLKSQNLLPEAADEKSIADKLKGLQKLRIGVLALQGDFREHVKMLNMYPEIVQSILVKKKEHLEELHGLIIPGGESTTFGILAERFGMLEPLKQFIKSRAVWGTCAGLIMICNNHTGVIMKNQKFLGGLNALCERNFFGAQVDSFTTTLDVKFSEEKLSKMQAVFIRAPAIIKCGEGVKVLSKVEVKKQDKLMDIFVAVEQDNLLASSFHPQISGERDFHDYFLSKVVAYL